MVVRGTPAHALCRGGRASPRHSARARRAHRFVSVPAHGRRVRLLLSVDAPPHHGGLAAHARLRHRGTFRHPRRQARTRQDASRDRHRLPRDAERLRCLVHHRRAADRGPLFGEPRRPTPRDPRALHEAARARRRRGRLPRLRRRRRQRALPRRQRPPHSRALDDLHDQQASKAMGRRLARRRSRRRHRRPHPRARATPPTRWPLGQDEALAGRRATNR